MNSNPYILDKTDTYDIEGTLGNATFGLSTIQHVLDRDDGGTVDLTYEAAQGCILAIESIIHALNESRSRVELMRDLITEPVKLPRAGEAS